MFTMKSRFLVTFLATVAVSLSTFATELVKIEPGNWWTGMRDSRLELLVYGKDLAGASVEVKADDVRLLAVENADSPDYLFVTLDIGDKQPAGTIELRFKKGHFSKKVAYELKERRAGSAHRKGFDASDVFYLLMPDRFANGNAGNDTSKQTVEAADRNNPNGRHGGDIAGIVSKLDYLKGLGVTTLWPTPLWESNHVKNTYHGYACTDFYSIDPRYGTNEEYRQLAVECHKRGLKLVMDVVPNHCSISHPWMKNLPLKDWVHPKPEAAGRTLAISAWNDPHVSELDYRLNKDGWFSPLMPDMNQNNAKVLRYLVQNTIWWIEYADLDGLRVDTYPYCERDAIARWTKAITDEYPNMNIVGECWQPSVSAVAYWQKDARNYDGYNSYLPCVMDFPLMDAMQEAFSAANPNRPRHLNKLYASLAQDYLYADPMNILTFVDNHDTDRFATSIGKDLDLYKSAIAFLLTTRGIPQLYYGTEIMMDGDSEGIYTSNANRKEMTGGWVGDTRNVFDAEGRTGCENEVYAYISKLLNWRRRTPVVQHGKLMHFKPQDGVYVYFRYDRDACIMVAVNGNDGGKVLDTARFAERTAPYTSGVNVMTGETYVSLASISLPGKSTQIIELRKN